MDPHYAEWLNLLIRWVHLIVGIAWIGASFYFVWLENNLNRLAPRAGLSGDLWAIHGGGIYHLEKYSLAPPKMPEKLHWFKWEAYATWISGFSLLALIYYANAELYLIAPDSGLNSTTGILISLASLVLGWILYDRLCNSPLGQKPLTLAWVLLLFFVLIAWGLSQIFTGRAAYIHVGAIIGTIMVGNVFRVIMPGQRELVAAIETGRTPDPSAPAKAMLRSRHNNYLTLPVLFIMISNHFPSTYGHEWNWAILLGIALLSILVRHYFNTRHQNQRFIWTIPAACAGLLALAFVSHPERSMQAEPSVEVSYAEVEQIVQTHCVSCHAKEPTSELFSAPPAGLVLETRADIEQHAAAILAQAVHTQAMPLGNLSQMSESERALLGQWIRGLSESD